ncbi:LysR family transcriptional regulator ArgP [Nocardioides bigeumensis]|uniref:ArgP/LysG family DNA-binding transcriptional regulator n=1 Tax=Nocardioides bigeumensis TaxID=433657 RepID=A0ABP5KK10_9ACTN
MEVSTAQLAALVAIADLGTFEGAARHLRVTPSAISQRVRALETASGQVLVRRGAPCVPTAAGERLLVVARQTQLLLAEVADVLPDAGAASVDLPVAVNADSLATWLRPVLGEVGGWDNVALRLHVEDQAWSHELLRRGEVHAAVTSEATPVQGCRVERLGLLRYRPAASPEFVERWRSGRSHDWARMPMVVFNEKDALQHDVLDARGVDQPPVVHNVPTSTDFHEAVRRGLGWATLPEPQLLPDVEAGRLVLLSRREHLDVELYWQRWRLESPLLDRLTDAVRRAARAGLRR